MVHKLQVFLDVIHVKVVLLLLMLMLLDMLLQLLVL